MPIRANFWGGIVLETPFPTLRGSPSVLDSEQSLHVLAEVMPDPWGIASNGAEYRRNGISIGKKRAIPPSRSVRVKKTRDRLALNHRDPPPPISSTADPDFPWHLGIFFLSTMQSIRTIKIGQKLTVGHMRPITIVTASSAKTPGLMRGQADCVDACRSSP